MLTYGGGSDVGAADAFGVVTHILLTIYTAHLGQEVVVVQLLVGIGARACTCSVSCLQTVRSV